MRSTPCCSHINHAQYREYPCPATPGQLYGTSPSANSCARPSRFVDAVEAFVAAGLGWFHLLPIPHFMVHEWCSPPGSAVLASLAPGCAYVHHRPAAPATHGDFGIQLCHDRPRGARGARDATSGRNTGCVSVHDVPFRRVISNMGPAAPYLSPISVFTNWSKCRGCSVLSCGLCNNCH